MPEDGAAPRRADTLEVVEDGAERARVTALAVEADREPVRLVAHPLEELEPRRVRIEHHRLRAPGQEHLLDPLRERDHRHPRQVEGLHRGERGGELPLPAVHDDEVGRGREGLVPLVARAVVGEPSEPPRDDLRHRREVVLPVQAPDAELPVVRLLGHGVLEHDHGADRRLALDRRDVEALDADRQALQVERLPELLERLDSPEAGPLRLHRLGLEREARVLLGELLEPPLLTALGRTDLDPRPAPL